MIELRTYKITGIKPILMNNAEAMSPQGKGIASKKIPTPEVEAASKAYRNDDGVLYIPAVAFRVALLKAMTGRKIGKRAAWSIFAASVFCPESQCPLVHPKTGKPIKKYEIDVRRAVVQRQGILRARPRINEWACALVLEVDNELLPDVSLVLDGLQMAGKIVGVLDFRVEKRGEFGQFIVEE